jgi:hypothetical protein
MTTEEAIDCGRRLARQEARQAIVRVFVREHPTCSLDTAEHFRQAFLAVPGSTFGQWLTMLDEARLRWFRLTRRDDGRSQEVVAYSVDGALTSTGWQLADVRVEGPRGVSFRESERAWRVVDDSADGYWTTAEQRETAEEVDALDTTGRAFRYA